MAKHITGNTTLAGSQGVIPYGSVDESIVFQDALTAIPSNGVIKGAPTFSDMGMNVNAGGWQFDLSALTGMADLSTNGQLSIDIESEGIADNPARATNGIGTSGRDNTTAVNYFMTWANAASASAGVYGRCYLSNVEAIKCQFSVAAGNTQVGAQTTNYGAGTHKTLTLSWNGGTMRMYLDGAFYASGVAIKGQANLFSYVSIGSNRGTATFVFGDYSFKNFIISNRPVMLPTHPMLATVGMIGDSFVNQASKTGNPWDPTLGYEHRLDLQCEAYLAERGIGINLKNDAVSGSSIRAAAASTIQDQVATVLARRPQIVICQGGTNDVNAHGTYVEATFDTDYKAILTALLTAGTGVEKVFIGTVPSLSGDVSAYVAAAIAATASANNVIKALPSWWDTDNPSDTGRVVVYDLYEATGQEPAGDDMMAGTWSSGYDDYEDNLHLSSKGRRIFGRIVGEAIYKNLP